jgi:hypothetical protein
MMYLLDTAGKVSGALVREQKAWAICAPEHRFCIAAAVNSCANPNAE